uniref:PEP-CTERM protein-sorting domain-containing protein n=1 Tax=Solibacter usitatus (strain Ellin6076) TaxID=234267 RepID=Q01XI5_SOLUE
MKRSLALILMLGLAAICSLQAAPTVIQSGLGGTGTQWNTGVNGIVPGGQTNVVLNPQHPGWSLPVGTSQWISFVNNYSPTPNAQDSCSHSISTPICNNDYVSFYQDFTAGAASTGTLYVMADDTATVTLNGNKLFTAAGPFDPNDPNLQYSHCSDAIVGCLNPQTIGIVDMAPYLVAGDNHLVFTVFQRNGTGFGLDYYAEVVPEPGFYGVLALGLSGLALAIRRKRA